VARPGFHAIRILHRFIINQHCNMSSWLSAPRITVVSISLLLIVLAILPPFVGESIRVWLMTGFSAVCHQLSDRSPSLAGIQLAACHRCFGIYFGLFAGSLIIPVTVLRKRILTDHVWPIVVLSAAPAALDWIAGLAGIWSSGPWTRALTGAIFGFIGGAFILAAATDLVRVRRKEAV
jgi:uncharacterized membrane protein